MRPGFVLLLKCDTVHAEGIRNTCGEASALGLFLHFGCFRKITLICKQQRLNSHSSGGWRSEIRVSTCSGLCSVTDLSLCPHMEEGARGLCGVSFIKIIYPIHQGSNFMTILLPRDPTCQYRYL